MHIDLDSHTCKTQAPSDSKQYEALINIPQRPNSGLFTMPGLLRPVCVTVTVRAVSVQEDAVTYATFQRCYTVWHVAEVFSIGSARASRSQETGVGGVHQTPPIIFTLWIERYLQCLAGCGIGVKGNHQLLLCGFHTPDGNSSHHSSLTGIGIKRRIMINIRMSISMRIRMIEAH
mmetsp:Transcript_5271/g.8477  ORF Transcript_5271/g.8477 Transcript_5271/m.8477 type:complete len:175 (+) Transcript_5271:188-712(+)